MLRNAKVVWRSPEDIRQLIIDYYSEHAELPARPGETGDRARGSATTLDEALRGADLGTRVMRGTPR
jgi:hypothetical protein